MLKWFHIPYLIKSWNLKKLEIWKNNLKNRPRSGKNQGISKMTKTLKIREEMCIVWCCSLTWTLNCQYFGHGTSICRNILHFCMEKNEKIWQLHCVLELCIMENLFNHGKIMECCFPFHVDTLYEGLDGGGGVPKSVSNSIKKLVFIRDSVIKISP